MAEARSRSAIPVVLRWVARVWSLLLAAFGLLMALTPDPSVTEPVPFEDWFLLGIWGVAILALVVAWWWETIGATIAIVTMVLRELAWVTLKGRWIVSFLIVWALILPPAVLFLVAHKMESDGQSQASSGSESSPPGQAV
jgi:hypothetical protein